MTEITMDDFGLPETANEQNIFNIGWLNTNEFVRDMVYCDVLDNTIRVLYTPVVPLNYINITYVVSPNETSYNIGNSNETNY